MNSFWVLIIIVECLVVVAIIVIVILRFLFRHKSDQREIIELKNQLAVLQVDRQILDKRNHELVDKSDLTRLIGTFKAQLNQSHIELKSANEQFDSLVHETVLSQLVVSQIDMGVIVVDEVGNVQLVNRFAQQFIDNGASLGQPFQKVFLLSQENKPVSDIFGKVLKGDTVILTDSARLKCRRGNIAVRGKILPLKQNQTGKITGAVCFFEDNQEFINRLQEEKTFFSAAAHELRTPITVIRANIELMRNSFDKLDRKVIDELLVSSEETSAQLLAIINDFLNISRIEQGRLELKIEKFDILKLVDEVIKDQDLLIKQHKLFIDHDIQDVSMRMVTGDRAKTREILTNILTNAIKYTIQGGITVTHEEKDAFIATRITDTGIGVPFDYQSLLFKPFQQIGLARNQAIGKSTGLGLYISRKLARLMKGDLILEKSDPGVGSTFTFTLPGADV